MLILNYHRIGTPPPEARYKGMFVSPSMLAWHIRILKARGKRFVTVSEGVDMGCPSNCVAITFDDGYVDNFELGMPLLASLQVPATVYVVTSDIGFQNKIWSEAGDKLPANLMSWGQIKALKEVGWEIGSHSSEHVHHSRLDLNTQKNLITKSIEDFKTHLGSAPSSFAYPYGSYNMDTVSILEGLNLKAAVTIDSSGVNTALTPKLLLYRKPARGSSARHYLKSLNLLWQA